MRFSRFLQLVCAVFLLSLQARGADASYYAIIKSQQYLETNSAAGPLLKSTGAWVFDALVVASQSNAVTSATVQAPYGGPTQALLLQSNRTDLLFEQRFDSQQDLETAYTTGSLFIAPYPMTIYGANDGVQSGTLGFGAGGISGQYPPNVPALGNFDAAQSIDSTTAFTLTFNLYGGQTSDVVQVTVIGPATNFVFSSPPPFSSNALNGFSSSCLIPANALPAGTTLEAHLSLGRPVGEDTSSYPGATGVAVMGIDIQFPLLTRPAPAPPRITMLSINPAPPRIQFAGETNRNYHIQYTSDLDSWTDLVVTNSPTGTGTVVDDTAPAFGKRFYRIHVGP